MVLVQDLEVRRPRVNGRGEVPVGFQPMPVFPHATDSSDGLCEFNETCDLYGTPSYRRFCAGLNHEGDAKCLNCSEYQLREEVQRRFPNAVFSERSEKVVRLYDKDIRKIL